MSWDVLKGTGAWDTSLSEVPTFPIYNNTHLYFAYALRLFRPTLTQVQFNWVFFNLHARERWRSHDPMSHDEVLGVAFWSWYLDIPNVARGLLMELRETGGFLRYSSGNKFVFNIVEVEPCLQSACGEFPSYLSQAAYGIRMISRCFEPLQGHGSSFMRAWITIPLMAKFPISSMFIFAFQMVMALRRINLEDLMHEYFSNIPAMAEAAAGKSICEP